MTATTKLIALGVLLASLVAGLWAAYNAIDQGGFDRSEAIWKKAVADQKIEAAKTLATETGKVRAVEATLREFKRNQENTDATNKTTVAGLQRRLTSLAGPAGRLRDPNAARCGGSGGGAAGGAGTGDRDRDGDDPEAGGLLSPELTGLLRSQTEVADTINNAYISCRAQLFGDRERLR